MMTRNVDMDQGPVLGCYRHRTCHQMLIEELSHGPASPDNCGHTVTLSKKVWQPSKFRYEIIHVHLNTDLNNCCIFIGSVP